MPDSGPLRILQTTLEHVYALNPMPDVREFLVTDRVQAAAYGGVGEDQDEALLVMEEPGTLNLALFLDATVVDQLTTECLAEDRLPAWLLAAEGVSHFVCLARRAKLERAISQLELELQGEIDKFVLIEQQFREQGRRASLDALRYWLFDQPTLRASLTAEQRWRYRLATRLARDYCGQMTAADSAESRRQQLCAFYRLAGAEKVRHIQQLS